MFNIDDELENFYTKSENKSDAKLVIDFNNLDLEIPNIPFVINSIKYKVISNTPSKMEVIQFQKKSANDLF